MNKNMCFGLMLIVFTLLFHQTTNPNTVYAQSTEQIVFMSDRDGNNEIYIMDADGNNQRPLTDNSVDDTSPIWSPDGSQILFVRRRSGLYIMNADGSNERLLTDISVSSPSFSPDGRQIVFQSYQDNNEDIFLIDVNGSNIRRLTDNPAPDRNPVWSPDGNKILFLTFRDGGQTYVMNPDGSNQQYFSDFMEAFQWSPDGSQIAFSKSLMGNNDIYVMNADGSNIRRLTTHGEFDFSPSWSPDSSQIVFQSRRDGNSEIYIMDADGNNQRRLTNNSAEDINPRWRPIDQSNALSTQPTERPSSLRDETFTNIIPVDLTTLSAITPSNASQLSLLGSIPVGVFVDISGISADRSAIVVGSNNTATRGFFVFDIANLRLVEIPNTSVGFSGIVGEPEIAISPDGRYMAYPLSDEIAVYSFVEQRVIANLTGHSDTIHALVFSPSGDMLASAGSDERIIIWNTGTWRSMMTLEHNDLLDLRADTVRSLAFTPNEAALLSGTYANVDFWDLNTGQLVTNIDSDFFGVFSSPSTSQVNIVPNSTFMAMLSGGERIELWNLQNLSFYDSFEVNSSIFDINQTGSLIVAEGSSGFEVYDLFSTRTLFSSTTRFASKYYFALNDRVLVVIIYNTIQLWGVQ